MDRYCDHHLKRPATHLLDSWVVGDPARPICKECADEAGDILSAILNLRPIQQAQEEDN
jgi:hypothetical protein